MIPTLVELLEFCKNQIQVDIELKEGGYEKQAAKTVLDILKPEQFIVTSTYDKVLGKIKAINPVIRTGLIIGSRPR